MSVRPEASISLLATDAVAVALLLALATTPLADAFEGRRWLVAVVLGTGLGLALTLAARVLRWGPILSVLLLVVGALVVGPAVVAPDAALAGVIPTPAAERILVVGVVDAWRSALTLPLPLVDDLGVLSVPFLVGLLASASAATLLWRSRWPGAAPLTVVAAFVTAATFGASATELPLLRGVVLGIALLVWTRWRAQRAVRTSWPRRVALTAAVVAVAGVAGWGLTAASAGTGERVVLRDHVDPPLEQLDFKSPLSKYRNYYKNQKETALLEVDGLPSGARLRLATMDDFDGIVWNVSTLDRTRGTSAFRRATPSTSSDPITVQVRDYSGPWVPTVGAARGATLEASGTNRDDRVLLQNPASGSVAMYGDVARGDVYRVDGSTATSRDDVSSEARADRSGAAPAPATRIPALDKLVGQWIAEDGATSDMAIATSIEQGFHTKGFFSNGVEGDAAPSRSGHGAERIAALVQDPSRMIGNDEQYASAMALAAQRLGLPARVALGFEPDAGPVFTGEDIAAWTEVRFSGAGWVAFDPTPPEKQKPSVLQQDPNPVPQPNVVQPPVLPDEPAEAATVPPEGAGKNLAGRLWAIILAVLGVAWDLVKLAVLLSPLWGLVLAKWLRRRRRRAVTDPVARLSAGWHEVTDRARDLGTRLPASQTRHENSVLLADRFPTADLSPLAVTADRHVFGPAAPTEDEAAAYWADVETALGRMRRSVPWWRRPLAVLSPASIPWRDVGADLRGRAGRGAERVADSRPVRRLRPLGQALVTRVTSIRIPRRKSS